MKARCLFRFDNNPSRVYYSGQIVSGTVTLTTEKQKTIQGIYISVTGYAQVGWNQTIKRNNDRRKKDDFSVEFLSSRTYVVGKKGGNETVRLRGGVHEFTFQIHLQESLPSSFKGTHGCICYEIALVIERPLLKVDFDFREPITILKTFDLNKDSMYKKPIDEAAEKEFYNAFCGVETLKLEIYIPRSAYAIGQKILFSIVADNDSTVECRSLKIRLWQNIECISEFAFGSHNFEAIKLVEKVLGSVNKLSCREFQDTLDVPTVQASTSTTYRAIKISYSLEVVAIFAGYHSPLKKMIPITIGTVPILEKETFKCLPTISEVPSFATDLNNICSEFVPPSITEQHPQNIIKTTSQLQHISKPHRICRRDFSPNIKFYGWNI